MERTRYAAARRPSATTLALLLAAALAASGCGSGGPVKGRVSGKVNFDGKPIIAGTITFVATDSKNPNATGSINNGAYTLQTEEPGDGAVVGSYKVAISDIDPNALNTALPGEATKGPASAIPKKYTDANESGLTAKVESGSNTFDFDLTK